MRHPVPRPNAPIIFSMSSPSRIISRRDIAAALVGAAPAAGLAIAAPAQESADPLSSARVQIQKSLDAMREFDLPAETEPAFVFKA